MSRSPALLALCLIGISRAPAAPLTLDVDLREAPRGLIHAAIRFPAQPGALTLLYPRWIPGQHAPVGPINDLAGLKLTAGGRPLAWQRDSVNLYAFHVEVPPGVAEIEGVYDYLAPTRADSPDVMAAKVTSADLAFLEWNLVCLFPRTPELDQEKVCPSVRLPQGWQFGTALKVAHEEGGRVTFEPVTVERLIDSPLLAGAHFRRWDLTPGAEPGHVIDCAAESDDDFGMPPAIRRGFERMPAEYAAMMGTRHYTNYHFLLALSDEIDLPALEHAESSENGFPERAFRDPNIFYRYAQILPHEYFHSWNGKFRRPAGLLTPDYQKPMETALLWVYEGLTEYYGDVMAARAGFRTPEQYREELAYQAALLTIVRGREWRPLQDTADAAPVITAARPAWATRRRRPEYYRESSLIWLEADMLIRQNTGGSRSLDDFVRIFCGDGSSGPVRAERLAGEAPRVKPYGVEDVYAALNQVLSFDWKEFFGARITRIAPQAPLDGLPAGGWRLAYSPEPNVFIAAGEKAGGAMDLRFGIGCSVSRESGRLGDVVQGSAAHDAGLAPDERIVGVNGRTYAPNRLLDAVSDTARETTLELLIENGTHLRTITLRYAEGARYPHLERLSGRPDLMDETLRSRVRS